MKYILIIIASSLFVTSCQQSSTTANEHLFMHSGQWAPDDSVNTKIKERFNHGHIEYFETNGQQFRFLKESPADTLYSLQVKQNNQWVTNLSLEMPRWSFYISKDIDVDKYLDLTYEVKYGNIKVHFFDATKQQFDTGTISFSYDYVLLDTARLIYGVNNHIIGDYNWNVDLFSIKNRHKKYLLKATLYLVDNIKENNANFIIDRSQLYRCNNGQAADTTLIGNFDIRQRFSDFSLRPYMKDLVKTYVKD